MGTQQRVKKGTKQTQSLSIESLVWEIHITLKKPQSHINRQMYKFWSMLWRKSGGSNDIVSSAWGVRGGLSEQVMWELRPSKWVQSGPVVILLEGGRVGGHFVRKLVSYQFTKDVYTHTEAILISGFRCCQLCLALPCIHSWMVDRDCVCCCSSPDPALV